MRTPHSEPPGRACRSARPVQAPSLSVVPGPSSPAQKARSLGECPADIQRARKLSNVHFRPGSPEFASIGKCSLEIRQSARLHVFHRNLYFPGRDSGAAVVILTAVVGYGCYSLFREFRISR